MKVQTQVEEAWLQGGGGGEKGRRCRGEGVEVKVKVQTQVEESGLQGKVVGRGEKV